MRRLRASVTVESSFLIPIFFMITFSLVMLDFYMHDVVINKAVAANIAMTVEFEEEFKDCMSGYNDEIRIEEYKNKAIEYLKLKTIAEKNTQVQIEAGKNDVKVLGKGTHKIDNLKVESKIAVIKMDDFIRKTNAVKEALEDGRQVYKRGE